MPSFLSPTGSNRLRKTRDQIPVVETTTTITGSSGALGSGALGAGSGAGRLGGALGSEHPPPAQAPDRRSFVSFTKRPSTSTTTSSVNNPNLQRSGSWKRRFTFNILSRGKNRLSTEQQRGIDQGNVSSRIGNVQHQSTGSTEAGELGERSKDGNPLLATSAQQISALGPVTQRSKLSKARPDPSTSLPSRLPVLGRSSTKPPSRLVVASKSALVPPVVAPDTLSLPLESNLQQKQQKQQQQQGTAEMAATATATTTTTMTSMMQDPKPSYSLTLTADQPHSSPRHAQHQHQHQQHQYYNQASPPPPHHPSSATVPPMITPRNPARLSSPPPRHSSPAAAAAAPKALKQTTNAFSRPSHIELSRPTAQRSPAELSGVIDTPLTYYITPSQTPTLPDGLNPASIPTVMRPGPATPPLTEESGSTSSSTKLMILTDPSVEPWQGDNIHADIPGDRSFNGPPTPASSASSQTNPGKRVNFAEPTTTPTSSIHSVRSNGPSNSRFGNYRQSPQRPVSFPRGDGPRQLQMRGPPRGGMPGRPPRPPSPIHMSPPSMKTHIWAPLRPTQINCAAGHTFLPFRNKQHSILCTICRSMEFEGRGEPVKRSFYCTWCAVRMCGGCREELVGECDGNLAKLWDMTEEKRASNMVMVKEGKMIKRESAKTENQQKPTNTNSESTEPKSDVPTNQGERRSRTPQPFSTTTAGTTGDFPFPTQRPLFQEQSQPQQSRTPRPKSRTPQPEQQRAPQQQQSRVPRPQARTPQPEQSRTPPPQSRTPRPQSRTPQPGQSRTPQPREPRAPQPPPKQLRSPPPGMDQRPSDRTPILQRSRPTSQVPTASAKQYSSPKEANGASSSRIPTRASMPQLTPAETERYKLIPVTSHQKPQASETVVLVGEKQKAPSIAAASLKKKKGWFRGFGKK